MITEGLRAGSFQATRGLCRVHRFTAMGHISETLGSGRGAGFYPHSTDARVKFVHRTVSARAHV